MFNLTQKKFVDRLDAKCEFIGWTMYMEKAIKVFNNIPR